MEDFVNTTLGVNVPGFAVLCVRLGGIAILVAAPWIVRLMQWLVED